MNYDRSAIFYGRGARHIESDPNSLLASTFANGEIQVQIDRSLKGVHAVYVQGFGNLHNGTGVNDLIIESLITCDAMKRAGVKSLTVVLLQLPYARQDRKHIKGVPISAKVICDLFKSVSIDRLIVFDLHSDQIQGFMPNRVLFDHITLMPYMCNGILDVVYQIQHQHANLKMVSVDAGAIVRTRKVGEMLGIYDMALMSKLRDKPNSVKSGQLIGDVIGKTCILTDDMIDTGGSLEKAHELLMENGADKVIVLAVHGILSGPALNRLKVFDKVIIADTVPHAVLNDQERPANMLVVNIHKFLYMGLFPRVLNNRPIGDLMELDCLERENISGIL